MRKLIRALLNSTSRSIRDPIYRRLISIHPEPPHELTFKIAKTKEELSAAFRILHDAYVREGYMDPHPSGMRIGIYHALPSTTTLIAMHGNDVVGTVSIVRDSAFGFPLDKIYDVRKYRSAGRRLAEISALAVDKNYRGNKGEVLFPLLKFLYEYCVAYFGVDYMLIAVNPSRFPFYQAILFFEELQSEIVDSYDYVKGAKAQGGYLDLRDAYRNFARCYAGRGVKANLFSYFTEKKFKNFIFPDRNYFKVSDPVMTPELLDYFFNKVTSILADMTQDQRNTIAALYDNDDYRKVIPGAMNARNEKTPRIVKRFDFSAKGRVHAGKQRVIRMDVKNVSETGFMAVLEDKIRFGTVFQVNIAIGDFDIADLIVFPVWTNQSNLYGFQIEVATPNWYHLIGNLNRELIEGKSFSELGEDTNPTNRPGLVS